MASKNPVSPPAAPWAWAAAGAVIGLLLALVLYAPARWVAGAVERGTSGRVLLGDPRGTIWHGSAQLAVSGGEGSNDELALPTRLDWDARLAPTGLLLHLQSACCTVRPIPVRVRPGWHALSLAFGDGETQLPASLLAGLGTPWNTLQLDGELALSTQGLSLEWTEGRLSIAGRAELRALRMSSRLSTLRPMGSYRITVTGGASPALQLDTLEGSLQLAGTGQWVGSRLRFRGTANAAPDREEALANLLNIIGRRTGARSVISIG